MDLFHSYPYQLISQLRKIGFNVTAPEIIAKTGWSSGELIQQLNQTELLPAYDFVTLLIGVNNQYRWLDVKLFEQDFRELVKKAIQCTEGDASMVFVLSIPDWGVSPFGITHSNQNISAEIDLYNDINQKIALEYKTNYIDITAESRNYSSDTTNFVNDQLHYSAKVYTRWTELLLKQMLQQIH